jgi:hypothetical protein
MLYKKNSICSSFKKKNKHALISLCPVACLHNLLPFAIFLITSIALRSSFGTSYHSHMLLIYQLEVFNKNLKLALIPSMENIVKIVM